MFLNKSDTDLKFDFLEFSSEIFEENYNKVLNDSNLKQDVKINKLVREEVSTAFKNIYN